MRKFAILITMLLTVLHLSAQHFVGCRTGSGWAETPMLRTSFELEHTDLAPVGHSVTFSLRVVSLGYHEVYLNGTRVGDCVLQPAVSQLDRRALEVTYDITDLVREGDNELMPLVWLQAPTTTPTPTPSSPRKSPPRPLSSSRWPPAAASP